MDQTSTARTSERPIHRACVVAGCPCKGRTASSLPAQTALAAIVAQKQRGTAGRHRSPDPAWRFVRAAHCLRHRLATEEQPNTWTSLDN